MMKGTSVLALGGMQAVCYMSQYSVEIQRPLLQLDKQPIAQFARRFGVPFFKDTTPSWSTRGKLRRQLVPLLQDMYGDGVLAKLSALAADADALNSLMHLSVFDPFYAGLVEGAAGACITREHFLKYLEHPAAFWKHVLRHVCVQVGAEVPREGGIEQLLDRQRKAFHRDRGLKGSGKRKEGGAGGAGVADMRSTWLQARQHSRTLLHAGALYILSPAIFPAVTQNGNPLNPASWQRGLTILVGQTYVMGPWTVTLSVVPCAHQGMVGEGGSGGATAEACVRESAGSMMTMEDVVKGFIFYDLPCEDVGNTWVEGGGGGAS